MSRFPRAIASFGYLFRLMFLGVTVALAANAAQAKDVQTAEAVMTLTQDVANKVITEIRSHQAEITKNHQALRDIIDRVLLPHVDSERMSKLVLGRYWRRADARQRKEFIEQFRLLLIRTYAGPLSKLGDQKVEVTGTKPGPDKDELVVQSIVSGGDLGKVPVDYRVAYEHGSWKYYDLIIDGISLVNNYRGSFAQEIQNKGIDGLIQTLKSRNEG